VYHSLFTSFTSPSGDSLRKSTATYDSKNGKTTSDQYFELYELFSRYLGVGSKFHFYATRELACNITRLCKALSSQTRTHHLDLNGVKVGVFTGHVNEGRIGVLGHGKTNVR
jgi:hypothetical protein